jgi:hypothetical protein
MRESKTKKTAAITENWWLLMTDMHNIKMKYKMKKKKTESSRDKSIKSAHDIKHLLESFRRVAHKFIVEWLSAEWSVQLTIHFFFLSFIPSHSHSLCVISFNGNANLRKYANVTKIDYKIWWVVEVHTRHFQMLFISEIW